MMNKDIYTGSYPSKNDGSFFIYDFLCFSVFVGIFAAFFATSMFAFELSGALFKSPIFLILIWTAMNLIMIPAFNKNKIPITSNVAIILVTSLAFLILIIESMLLSGSIQFGALFKTYVLCGGFFVSYINIKQIKALKNKNYSVEFSRAWHTFIHGYGILDWIWRILFLLMMFQLLSFDIFIYKPFEATGTAKVGLIISPFAPVILVTSIFTIIGIIKKYQPVVILSNLVNIVFAFYVFNSVIADSPDTTSKLPDLIGHSGWVFLTISAMLVVSAFLNYFTTPKTRKDIVETFPEISSEKPFKFRELIPFILLGVLMLCFIVDLASPETRLRNAIVKKDVKKVEMVLSKHAELVTNKNFAWAIDKGEIEIIKLFLQHNSKNNLSLSRNSYPANLLRDGRILDVQYLISQGLDFYDQRFVRRKFCQSSPRAAKEGFKMLEMLFAERAKRNLSIDEFYTPNQTNMYYSDKGFTNPLAIAIANRNVKLVKYLLGKGFRIDDEVLASSIIGLHLSKNPVVMSLKVTGKGELKKPLAFYFIEGKLSKKSQNYFLSLGIDLKEKDANGNNIFHHAANRYSRSSGKYILEKAIAEGVDINLKNSDSQTPLWIAATTGKTEIFIELLKLGADHKILNKKGQTLKEFCKQNLREIMLGYLEKR